MSEESQEFDQQLREENKVEKEEWYHLQQNT